MEVRGISFAGRMAALMHLCMYACVKDIYFCLACPKYCVHKDYM